MSNPATLKPFKKGKDPRRNITGANRGSKWLTTLLDEALRKMAEGHKESYDALLIKRVLRSAIVDGDMRAVEHIWDRIEGKPKSNEITQPNVYNTVILTEEQARRLAKRYLARVSGSKKPLARLSGGDKPKL